MEDQEASLRTANPSVMDDAPPAKQRSSNVSTKTDWAAFESRALKRGVIYLSRIPPFMSVSKIRRTFSEYGELGRIYLSPEDAAVARRRRKFKGCSRKKFVDGWVEFAKKSVAKRVAESFNNTQIGGKKRNYYYDDIWNIRYLNGFKWHHLTEKLAYENAVRTQKRRQELSAAKRENEFVQEKQQQAHVLGKIHSKQRRQAEVQDGGDPATPKVLRHFRQKPAVHDDAAVPARA